MRTASFRILVVDCILVIMFCLWYMGVRLSMVSDTSVVGDCHENS